MSRLQFTSQSCHFVQWYCQLWYIFGAFLFRIFFLKETKTFNLNTPDGKGELELWTFSELFPSKVTAGLPWWLSGKEFACQCQRCGFNPRVRKILWRRKWQPTPVFLPGKSHEQRSLAAPVHGVARVRHDLVTKATTTTEWHPVVVLIVREIMKI